MKSRMEVTWLLHGLLASFALAQKKNGRIREGKPAVRVALAVTREVASS